MELKPEQKEAGRLSSNAPAQRTAARSLVLPLEDNRPRSIIQRKANSTGLPDNLKSGIENLSGHSMDDVKVHYNSSQPAQLNAHAYAQGNQIHLASGQEKHLPHEAWHVVQQKQGRVKPTMQMKGKVNVNDDKGLEKEADVMGAKALQMKTNLTAHTTSRKVLGNVVQRVMGDFAKCAGKAGQFIKYSVDNGTPQTGQIDSVDGAAVTIGGVRYPKLKVNGGLFKVFETAVSEAGLTVSKEIKPVAASTQVNDHMGGFEENFGQHDNHPSTLNKVRALAKKTPGVGDNLNCDLYAVRLQEILKTNDIPYTPLLITIDIMSMGSDLQINLNEPGHKYDRKMIGIDSHIATVVVIDGLPFVFDNHTPNGVALPRFVSSLNFYAHYVPKGAMEAVEETHATLVASNKVKVFIMEAREIRGSGSGWRAALVGKNPKQGKAHGTTWGEFMRFAFSACPPEMDLVHTELGEAPPIAIKTITDDIMRGKVPWLKRLILSSTQLSPFDVYTILQAHPHPQLVIDGKALNEEAWLEEMRHVAGHEEHEQEDAHQPTDEEIDEALYKHEQWSDF